MLIKLGGQCTLRCRRTIQIGINTLNSLLIDLMLLNVCFFSSVGVEFEYLLRCYLDSFSVPYQTEAELRLVGRAKTPDFLLLIPIVLNGKLIHWIDSKAAFADENTLKKHQKDQLNSYVNRFEGKLGQ